MTLFRFFGAATLLLSCANCNHQRSTAHNDEPTPNAASARDASSANGSRDASAPSSSTPSGASRWSGTYTVSPGTLPIPTTKDYAGVRAAPDDPQKFVGQGSVSLSVDASGKVTGTADSGPLAPGLLDGVKTDKAFRGIVRRKDPTDEGLTGTWSASASGRELELTFDLADGTAAFVRAAKAKLTAKTPDAPP